MYLKIILFLCFLIISCDLPNEADVDCYGTSNGNAFINECGYCVGGNSSLNINEGIICGKCNDGISQGGCDACGIDTAINYYQPANEDLVDWPGIDGSCECNEACDGVDYLDVNEDEFIDNCFENNVALCVDNVCDDYLPESIEADYTCNDQPNNSVYNVGDLLSCEDAEKNYSISYPDECDTEFKFADLYGKVIFVEISTSW